MDKKTCKVSLNFYDDIKSYHAVLLSTVPYVLKIPKYNKSLFDSADSIVITYSDNVYDVTNIVKIIRCDDTDITFEILSTAKENKADKNTFFIDHKSSLTVAVVDKIKTSVYVNIAEMINLTERNNLAKKLKYSLTDVDIENEVTLNYLSEINRKLDELLALARPAIDIPDKFDAYFINLSSTATTFFTKVDISTVPTIFLTATLQDNSERITFASIASLEVVRINDDNSGIYIAHFINMDEDITDAIIRFMFSRERDTLKSASNK